MNNVRKAVLGMMVMLLAARLAAGSASEHQGRVMTGSVPVPGALVTAVQEDKKITAVTNEDGVYSFPGLGDGQWIIAVEITGFKSETQPITVGPDNAPAHWDLKILPLPEVKAESNPGFVSSPPALRTLEIRTDGLLINGSVNNGASTPFALPRAIGNNRKAVRSLYTGALSWNASNAVFDARPYSLTGQDTPQSPYSRMQGSITYGGPLQIPNLFRNGSFSMTYGRVQSRNANLWTARVPTAAERAGDFSNVATPVIDPSNGLSFPGNKIPSDRISPQALALVSFYPMPNFTGASRYNYQIATTGVMHEDNLQGGFNNVALNTSNRFSGSAGVQSSRSTNSGLFGFADTVHTIAVNTSMSWVHRFNSRISATVRFQFNRSATTNLPYFANHFDVASIAGISGNDRDPRNWGPPNLNFAGGMARLTDATFASNRTQWNAASYSSSWNHGRHSFTYGAEYRRQQFNLFSQQDARGTFTFTGAASGNDFADFLLSIPAATSIAFGNPDKYFRQSFANGFVSDDWRFKSSLSFTLGVRWEYESPVTEKFGRLVNVNIASDFSSASIAIAESAHDSLIEPDRLGLQPRLGLAWRPSLNASTVIRAGYGIYRDVNVYRAIADQMAQQAPLSKSFSVQNSELNPLTLANGFVGSSNSGSPTFAVDPHFHPGNAQNWQLSVQQDLPQAMQMTVTYLGIKGTHIPRRILPNTYPLGMANPCPRCPIGFIYLAANGNSSRHSGSVEVRRRQRNGFQASVQYTFAKAIDDAGLGGTSVAQSWRDPREERGRSNFDQRHLVVFQAQYTSGMLTHVGGFLDGWRGALLKQWTLTTNLSAGSGLPLTPVMYVPVPGTGFSGILRPDTTGEAVRAISSGSQLNPLAFRAPAAGEWGNAGRNSITGPAQFSLNASLARSFRFNEKVSMDFRVDSNNVLNHATFPGWNTSLNSAQFGLPASANAMRSIVPSIRLRF